MQYNPHTYQTRLKDFIIDNPYAFLTVDMGLGKTVTTLTAIQELKDTYVEISRVLVIAPKSVAENTSKSSSRIMVANKESKHFTLQNSKS